MPSENQAQLNVEPARKRRPSNWAVFIFPVFLSLVLSSAILYSYFNNVLYQTLNPYSFDAEVNLFYKISGGILFLPEVIFSVIILLTRSMSLAFGAQILIPAFAFVFWYVVFVFLLWLIRRLILSVIVFYAMPLVLVFTLSIPVVVLSDKTADSSIVEKCLLGQIQLSITTPSGRKTAGPDFCLRDIIFDSPGLGPGDKTDAKELIDFCVQLSDEKIAVVPPDSITDIPLNATFQEFCIFTIEPYLRPRVIPATGELEPLAVDFHQRFIAEIPLPVVSKTSPFRIVVEDISSLDFFYQLRLCEVFGSFTGSDEKKRSCLLMFFDEDSVSFIPKSR